VFESRVLRRKFKPKEGGSCGRLEETAQ